ncbi:MAG: 30S ribosomal protein S1 [Desulfobacterium sp.]|nr:30S ribosomal protein S1 [Desulfobacterium sp.]
MNNIAETGENNEMNSEELETAQDQESNTDEESMETPVANVDPLANLTGEETMEELMGIYDESYSSFEEGQVVTGTIIAVDKDHVLVDVGYKSEGQISIHEFRDEEGVLDVNLNDRVEVMVEVWDEEAETVILSKEKAAKVKVWDAIKDIYEDDGTIEGVITSRVKGGFSVDIGLPAFLPGSQADLRPIRNMDEMVGQTYTFKVLKYNRKRSNIVLSRRVILEVEREKARTETLGAIENDKVMEGVVKNITEYGVFVDLGGVDGLLHITDISWGRVKHPSELFSVADKINVKILSYDLEKERVSLGLKQLTPDPWTTAQDKYPMGSKVLGKVVSLTDYGAFVELEEGVEGLIHVSEMSWTRKVRHPSKIVSVGEEVEAVVLDLKPDNRRISLGIKQTVENPWEVISEKYPVGTVIEGKIKNITDFGLFIGIDDDIDGLVHISDISWTKRIKHPSEVYKKNDTVQAVVLDIDKSSERFSLGIKQIQPDPWETVEDRYKVGTEISGVVTNITDFGVFVELEEGIEGLVHVSEISKEKIKTPAGVYNMGDTITARVMNINSDERRIGLSIKRLDEEEDEVVFKDFSKNLKPATSSFATSSFGELLRDNIQEQIASQEKGDDTKEEE